MLSEYSKSNSERFENKTLDILNMLVREESKEGI